MIRTSVGVAVALAALASMEPARAQSREFNQPRALLVISPEPVTGCQSFLARFARLGPLYGPGQTPSSGSRIAARSRIAVQTVNLNAGGSLRVDGSKGSIRISSWDKPQVEIRARIDEPDDVSDDYARRAVEATAIDVSGDERSVTVATNYERVPLLREGRWGQWGNNEKRVPSVHYDIRAPRSLRLSVDSDRGPATVQGFEGVVDVVVDRGELELRDVSGDIRISIDRGGQSRLEDVRGSVVVDADRTDLRIDARALDRDSRIEIDRGDAEISVPGRQRLTVRTEISRRGDFNTDFPIEWSSTNPRRSSGRINGGGTELFVESDRAHVRLRRLR